MSRPATRRRARSTARTSAWLAAALVAACTAQRTAGTARAPGPRRALRVPALMYHQLRAASPDEPAADRAMTVTVPEFEAQLDWLVAHGYRTVTVAQLLAAMDGDRALPPRPVVLTFDDGWAEDYAVALPALARRGLAGTFYVYCDAVGWPRRMTWDQVRALAARGMEVGSHSMSHPHLPALTADEQAREVGRSREVLGAQLGGGAARVATFAYPYGELSAAVVELVRRAGYAGAMGTAPGLEQRASERYALHRVLVRAGEGMAAFEASVTRGLAPPEIE